MFYSAFRPVLERELRMRSAAKRACKTGKIKGAFRGALKCNWYIDAALSLPRPRLLPCLERLASRQIVFHQQQVVSSALHDLEQRLRAGNLFQLFRHEPL